MFEKKGGRDIFGELKKGGARFLLIVRKMETDTFLEPEMGRGAGLFLRAVAFFYL